MHPAGMSFTQNSGNTVIEWTQNTLAPKFHFPVLWVLAYGDFTSGELHKACERSYYCNQFKNCLAIGQLHALMYRDLAAHFEQVNVLYLDGNHGRRTPKKDYLTSVWSKLDRRTAPDRSGFLLKNESVRG